MAERDQDDLTGALERLRAVEIEPQRLSGTLVLQRDKMRLLHFQPEQASATPPLLICYALVNRPYILDLEPRRSLLRDLLAQGKSVYLIDWGYPDLSDRYLGLDDYIGDYLDQAVSAVLQHSGQPQLDLLGVCQGGVFALSYACLNPEPIRRLVTLVTPIDTGVAGFTLSQMMRHVDLQQLVAAYGNLPGEMLNQLYASLKPLQLGVFKRLTLVNNLGSSEAARTFILMEQWINDSPDLAGRAAVEFGEQFFKENGLVRGTLKLATGQVDLSRLSAPLLNIFGTQDHLVPPASSQALGALLHKQLAYQELPLNAGHIGAFISRHCRHQVVAAVSDWLR